MSTTTLSPDQIQQLFSLHRATTLDARIMALRRFYGISYHDLAKRTGLSPSVVWRLENDTYTYGPRVETVERVADALGVTAHELMEKAR